LEKTRTVHTFAVAAERNEISENVRSMRVDHRVVYRLSSSSATSYADLPMSGAGGSRGGRTGKQHGRSAMGTDMKRTKYRGKRSGRNRGTTTATTETTSARSDTHKFSCMSLFAMRFSLASSAADGVFGLVCGIPPEWKHQMVCVSPGVWRTLSMDQFKRAIEEAGSRGARVEAPDPRLIDLLCETHKGHTAVDWSALGSPTLRANVMPHQVRAVDRVVAELGGRAIVALPTGTGKSLTAAAVAAHYGGWVLIIASAQTQWREEFEMWTEFESYVIVNGSNGEMPDAASSAVVISTYKSVGLREDIKKRKWTTVIVDESHKLGGDCDTNKAIVDVCKRAKCALMVSATPMKNRPREMFNTLRALLPHVFTNRKKFEERYCDGKQGRFGYEANGATNTEEMSALVDHLSVTCDKHAVLPDLPPITYEDVRLTMSAEVVQEFQEMQTEYDDLTRRADEAPEHLKEMYKFKRDAVSTRMYVHTAEVKTPHCVAWLLDFLGKQKDRTEKVLVFYHHELVKKMVCAALTEAGVGYVQIDGAVPTNKRHAMLRPIRDPHDEKTRVALLTLGTCAESLNLCGACVVVMFQLAFTPAQNDQAYARAWRKGATRPVRVYRMIANGTHDETMLRILSKKETVTEKIFKKVKTSTN